MNNILEIKNLQKIYKSKIEDIVVLDNLNLNVKNGQLVSIVGKSGSGKTSLLNIIGLLDTEYTGEFKINSDNPKIGFVFQFHHLLPEFTALENIMLPSLANDYKNYDNIKSRAIEILKIIGLENRSDYLVSNLSGGEKQRVSIARAMIDNPDIILADEPTGNLDEQNSKIINDLLKKINKEQKITTIIVTHSKELADIADVKYKLVNKKLVEY